MLIFGSIVLIVREIPLSSAQIALIRGVVGSIFLIMAGLIVKKKPSIKAIRKNFTYLLLSGAALCNGDNSKQTDKKYDWI